MKEEIETTDVAEAAREGFEGLLVPKGPARELADDHPLPSHVVESAFAQYFESNGIGEDQAGGARAKGAPEGGSPVETALRQTGEVLAEGVLPPGNEEVFKSDLGAKEEGRLIDHIQVRFDASREIHIAELSRLGATAVARGETVRTHKRLLQDGIHAWITLRHDPESGPAPFTVVGVDPLQPSGEDLLGRLREGRQAFSPGEWAHFLARSIGLDPFEGPLGPRELGLTLLRLVPLCERNYNLVELGPRGTGKSHLFGQLSSRAHLLSGGKASVSKLFVHTGTGERGLVTSRDVVAFDEISSTSFRGEEAVSALKDYMESGQATRGKEEIQGEASIVMLGNIDRPVEELLEESHLFASFPDRIDDDTALMARIHGYLPGWEVPKIGPDDLAEGLGLTSGFLAECLHRLRRRSLKAQIGRRADLGGNLIGRDRNAALKTASGLLKLTYPGLVGGEAGAPETTTIEEVPRAALRWALWMGMEARLRVRQQQHRIQPEEFEKGDFRLTIDPDKEESTQEQVFLPEEPAQ